jgi:hypothetical protein
MILVLSFFQKISSGVSINSGKIFRPIPQWLLSQGALRRDRLSISGSSMKCVFPVHMDKSLMAA